MVTVPVWPLQPENAYLPIEVTELGIVTEVRALLLAKVYTPIAVSVNSVSPSLGFDGSISFPVMLFPGESNDEPAFVWRVLAASSMTVLGMVWPS